MKMEKWKFRHPRYSSKSNILANAGDVTILLLAVLIVGFQQEGYSVPSSFYKGNQNIQMLILIKHSYGLSLAPPHCLGRCSVQPRHVFV
jgi:hypothetical protein